MLREVFSEGLALQKARLNEERSYAREHRLEQSKRHLEHISSMENYYRDQVRPLAVSPQPGTNQGTQNPPIIWATF